MTKTVIGTSINQPFVGYMINVELSEQNKQKVADVQQKLTGKFGKAIWHQPPKSLHITLLDWIAPLVDYGENKDKLFEKIYQDYDKVISTSLRELSSIEITLDRVEAAPAAIFTIGNYSGEFAKIRQYFLDNVELIPNTKRPPEIIHSTISRFVQEIELEQVQEFLKTIDLSMTQKITSFRLVREEIDPMLKFKLIKEYALGV